MATCPVAAHDAGERAEQPVGERAGEDHVGIFERRRQHRPAAAQPAVDGGPAQQEDGAEQRRGAGGDHQRMDDERRRVLAPAGADRPRDRGGDRAAHGHVGHLLHQHQQREHQRQAGQRIEAEPADEMRVDAGRHRDQHDVDHEVGHREPQQGGERSGLPASGACAPRRAMRVSTVVSVMARLSPSSAASCASRRSGCGTTRRARRTSPCRASASRGRRRRRG